MKTEHWTGETPCKINGFRNFEFLILICNGKLNNIKLNYVTDLFLTISISVCIFSLQISSRMIEFMNEFVFLDTDITGTEDYDIKGQDYSNLINICCKYCSVLSFRIVNSEISFKKELEK